MRSHSSSLNLHFSRLGLPQSLKFIYLSRRSRIAFESRLFRCNGIKLNGTNVRKHGSSVQHKVVQVKAMDEDSAGVSFLDDWGDYEGNSGYMASSSDGEDSDGDIVLNPIHDVDLPSFKDQFASSNDALTVTAHRLAILSKRHKKHRIMSGFFVNMGLITFLTTLLLLVDWCSWKIVRLPLAPFYLTCPFFISAVLASCAGYICVPLLRSLKIHQVLRKEGPVWHSSKRRTATMGGLFFIPVGIIVAKFLVGFSSVEVSGAAVATAAFAAVGLLDDIVSHRKNHHNGVSAWIRICLEVAIGIWFSFWLYTTSISSPYDGLDGLAGGTAALAFVGMSIAVLPICSDVAVFGASMAGACVGFLLHNRYKASVFMGDTGSLALGGALAAMAASTGMFLPLFISSGIFVLEVSSVIMQVSYFKTTRRLLGAGRRLFRMAPFHHHLELCGFKEPVIVACAYVISSILAVFAGYVGLISA